MRPPFAPHPPAAWLNPNKPLHTDLTTKSDINHEGSTTPEKGRELARPPKPPLAIKPLGKKNAALCMVVGERLKAARELCNLSLSEAARLLGYANPSKLSKVENATDTNSVPFWLIPTAAQLYDVSTEYLFGLSEEWETGCYRGITPFLQQQWDQQRARDLKAISVLNRRILAALEAFPNLAWAATSTLEALEAFRTRNEIFDDLPGGARLMATAHRLRAVAADANAAQKRLRLELPPELIEEAENA